MDETFNAQVHGSVEKVYSSGIAASITQSRWGMKYFVCQLILRQKQYHWTINRGDSHRSENMQPPYRASFSLEPDAGKLHGVRWGRNLSLLALGKMS
jgi:hypothetical protein